MFNSNSKVLAYIKDESIKMVDFKFSNLYGGWHHITIPGSRITEQLLENGVGFDSSSTPGFRNLEAGDMSLVPDLTTAFIDPFCDERTLSFICNIVEADTKQRFHRCPRFIAEKAEDYLRTCGVADRSLWGPEFEFNVFDSVNIINSTNHSAYQIESKEAHWNRFKANSHNLGYHIPKKGGYHAIPPHDTLHNLRSAMVRKIEGCGIPVYYHHHEVGSAGQVEIEVVMGPLTRMGDVTQIIKYLVKMTARQYDKVATFMPKPLYGDAGNGMHYHQHLFQGDEPVFYKKGGYADLSPIALSYIAGILDHSPALLALTNPSTNSFKRLVPGFEAPVNLFFSLANRSAAIRIPKYATSPLEKRMEFRPPDATANPYLAMSAMLLAGLDGIKRKLDPTEMGFGPIDENIFLPENSDLRNRIIPAPQSIRTALKMLEQDHEFLLQGDVFTEDIIDTWIHSKMEKEYQEVRNRPTPYELELYFDI
jgi:glutamine synthetase